MTMQQASLQLINDCSHRPQLSMQELKRYTCTGQLLSLRCPCATDSDITLRPSRSKQPECLVVSSLNVLFKQSILCTRTTTAHNSPQRPRRISSSMRADSSRHDQRCHVWLVAVVDGAGTVDTDDGFPHKVCFGSALAA